MFELPKLNYAFDAIEPYIDAKTMEIHHGKHHQTYIDNLNKALTLEENQQFSHLSLTELLAEPKALQIPMIRNNAGGHYNHSFFWEILGVSQQNPKDKLLNLIQESFGDFEKFKAEFKTKALGIFGSGWLWLCLKDQKLHLIGMPNQDNPLMNINDYQKNGQPVLGLDVWEHAYYLKYQNKRADYVDAFFQIINWNKIEEKL